MLVCDIEENTKLGKHGRNDYDKSAFLNLKAYRDEPREG